MAKPCVMLLGVSGSGKSTLGKLLSQKLQVEFLDADDFHPPENIAKMSRGDSLNDQDRLPWLKTLAEVIKGKENNGFVLACSALKKSYRNILSEKMKDGFSMILLDGSFDLIYNRISNRENHFMPVELLRDQFSTLEFDSSIKKVDIDSDPNTIVENLIKLITLSDKNRKAEIGVLGLGVMGKSLARNFASKKIVTAVYNVPFPGEENVTINFIKKYKDSNFLYGENLSDFLETLESPKKILLMIKSGDPIDEMIEKLIPHLAPGDIIIDAGNSFFKDSVRRSSYLKEQGLEFVGMGVSGGEEGALKGPSMMPAGSKRAKSFLLPMFQSIAAKADEKDCVAWIGDDGAGHFVKMVHNGIEYADMQLLSETYGIGKNILIQKNKEFAVDLEAWKTGLHNSYLLDISIEILKYLQEGESLLESILDVAQHKGTGQWTVKQGLELGVSMPTIASAMNQRILSGEKNLREKLANSNQQAAQNVNQEIIENNLEGGILFCRLIALAEGFHLMRKASIEYGWELNFSDIAQLWRGGCIIRSNMLKLIIESSKEENSIEHLFSLPAFAAKLQDLFPAAQKLASELSKTTLPTPAINAALNYYKSLQTAYLSINMVQAQRDYFGAHTFKTLKDRKTPVHVNWSNHG